MTNQADQQPDGEQGQWHKVTLKPQYPTLDQEQVYVCDCGESEPVERAAGTWEKDAYVHNGRWAVDLDDHIDAIIRDHTTAAQFADCKKALIEAEQTLATEVSNCAQALADMNQGRLRAEAAAAQVSGLLAALREADALALAMKEAVSIMRPGSIQTDGMSWSEEKAWNVVNALRAYDKSRQAEATQQEAGG